MISNSSALSEGDEVQLDNFSARETIAASYRFLFANLRSILRALWLPSMLAAVVLLVLFKAYFTMLAIYWSSPNPRVASLTASVMAATFLIWLSLNIIASARVARVVRREPIPGWLDFQAMAPEARLYAAVLQLLLIFGVAGFVVMAATLFLLRFVSERWDDYAIGLGWAFFAIPAIVFSIRCGLLGPALALYERRGILHRGWQLSRDHVLQLAFIWVVLLVLPALLLQGFGEVLIQSLADGLAGVVSLAAAADELARNDAVILAIVLTLTLSVSLCLVLSTIGSCLAYQGLKERE